MNTTKRNKSWFQPKKDTGECFSTNKIENHTKIQALLKEKKFYPKKSLTPLLHQAIQLNNNYLRPYVTPGHKIDWWSMAHYLIKYWSMILFSAIFDLWYNRYWLGFVWLLDTISLGGHWSNVFIPKSITRPKLWDLLFDLHNKLSKNNLLWDSEYTVMYIVDFNSMAVLIQTYDMINFFCDAGKHLGSV